MSATNRGGKRSEADNYPTPPWCVQRLVEAVELPAGNWLEPAAGDGAIIRAVGRRDVRWTACEIRTDMRPIPRKVVRDGRVLIGDFLLRPPAADARRARFDVAITNPPFRQAQEFIDACLKQANIVAMLLRLNYLASKKRWRFMTSNAPDVFVLPSRPSFTGAGTDSIEYAWFLWPNVRRREGRIRVLGLKEGA